MYNAADLHKTEGIIPPTYEVSMKSARQKHKRNMIS